MNSLAKHSSSPAAELFSTKAATLEFLRPHVTTAVILPLYRLARADYQQSEQATLSDIMRQGWAREPLIVRSSALGEDSSESSQAGHFQSVLNVTGPAGLRVAIETVIASYGDADPRHEILIQPMLTDVAASGVVFSVDPNTLSPYAVISIAEGADTTAVTSGRDARTVLVSRHATQINDARFIRLLALIDELEALTGSSALDIEFAFDTAGQLYLFQVRPLVLRNSPTISAALHKEALAHIAEQIAEKSRPHPYLCGQRTMFGVMPD